MSARSSVAPVIVAGRAAAGPPRDPVTVAWDDYADACLEHDPLQARLACDQLRHELRTPAAPKARR